MQQKPKGLHHHQSELAWPGTDDVLPSRQIEDFTLGKNSFRILNMRALPDQPEEDDYPKEEWIDQGDRENALDPTRREPKSDEDAKNQEAAKERSKSEEVMKQENPEDEEQTGDYVNYEVSFA